MIVAVGLGLVLGLGSAAGLEYFDRSLKTPDDVERRLGLAAIAIVPKFSGKTRRRRKGRRRAPRLVAESDPQTPASEAYRTLRTNLAFAAIDSKPRTLVVTSATIGEGKTTTAAKLALTLKARDRKPLLAAADLQRPGAVEQLQPLGGQIGIPVYSEKTNPVDVCRNAVAQAKRTLCDVVILDTAGRLQIDAELMDELKRIDKLVKPDECYLVVDAMIGQQQLI